MSYSLLANDIAMSGWIYIGSQNGPNANVHSNTRLDMAGGGTLHGFASYVTTSAIGITVSPVDNPDNLPAIRQTGRVEIPRFRARDYAHLATRTIEGTYNLGSGPVQLGTRENPKIIHATGDIKITGDLDFHGYGIFMADGEIKIDGNMTLHGATQDENTVAFYTSSNIHLSGEQTMRGQIMAGGVAHLSSRGDFCGSLTAYDRVAWSGENKLYYCNASPALTEPIWPSDPAPGEQAWRATNYREWASHEAIASVR